MILWIDAQLSPAIAKWIAEHFAGIEASAVRDLGYRDAADTVIFFAARAAGAAVMTKDSDFVELQNSNGAPPKVIWVTCGNTSNRRLQEILTDKLGDAIALLEAGEDLVEITGI
jgi:predicted nuclease of predicted toxin-antitoxin system